jgi:Flp pilus assembly protein TadB
MSSESSQPGPMLRASDAEREQTVSSLRAHHAAGRLQTDELDQRIAEALTATTVTQLDQQLRDLPKLRNLRTEPRGRRLGIQRVTMIVAIAIAVATVVTAIALSSGVRLIWILPLLWFAGPWQRRGIRTHRRGRARSSCPQSRVARPIGR